tara:strand:- start:33 stop:296 length:264 start_codon:yes stop_codon:yes gene_type:complete
MKLFVYKSLFITFLFFVIFHSTIGYISRSYEAKLQNTFSKDKIGSIKTKLLLEIENGIKKDRILNKEEALIIKRFINKIREEINDTK